MFLQKKEEPARDQLIILSNDNTADIALVVDEDDQRIFAQSPTNEYSIPIADLQAFVGSKGRIYYLGAVPEYIEQAKSQARLEMSTVLGQITHYKVSQEDKASVSIKDILTYVIILLLILGLIFK